MSATIKYKGNTIASITTDSSKTLKTSGKYCEGDIVVENVQDGGITPSGNKAITATTSTQTGIDVTNYATVSVAPTPSETKSVTTNGDVTPSSGKLLSKVTVNVPTGTARDSSDLTVSSATVNVPAGLYSSAASKSVAIGTAGTPKASKGAVSNNSVTVTPSVANTTGYITGGTKTGTGVTVSASELVSGNKAITPSETAQSGIDVTNFKTASVGAIPSTYVGSGVTRKAEATVAPSTSEQTVCASGIYTTGAQKVSAITPSIVGNLDASSFASSIVAAIEGKGVTVPDGTLLDGMAALIEAIDAGGGEMDTIFGHSFEYGSIIPNEDITSDYVINFSHSHLSPSVSDSSHYNFVMWCDTSEENVQNLSWLWLINGRKGRNSLFLYGQYINSNGGISNASYSGVVGNSGYPYQFTIYCQSSKKLLAGRKYNWIVVGNEV